MRVHLSRLKNKQAKRTKKVYKRATVTSKIKKDAIWIYSKKKSKNSQTYIENTAFIAMAFKSTPEKSRTYKGIKQVCSRMGIEAKRVDEIPGSIYIVKTIQKMICEAEFLIFDISYEKPNV